MIRQPWPTLALTAALVCGAGIVMAAQPRSMHWEVLVDAPPDRVWQALVSPDRLARWQPGILAVNLAAGRIEIAFDDVGARYGAAIASITEGQHLQIEVDRVPQGEAGASLRGTRWTVSLIRVSPASTVVHLAVQPAGPAAAGLRGLLKYPVLLALARLRTALAP